MRFLTLVLGTTFMVGAAGSAVAQQSNFESALYQSRYPTVSHEGICYAKTDTPNTFDLSRLCGSVPLSVPEPMSTGSNYGGVCNVPSDIARDGSRCSGRAASERPGGRLGVAILQVTVVVIPQATEAQQVAVFMFVRTLALMALLLGVIGAEGKLISVIALPTDYQSVG